MAEPTFRQRRLGEALQLLRERAGMSQQQVAARLHYNVPKISRIENGQVPDIHALRAMLDLYGVIGDEESPYLEMWELAREKGWWKPYRWRTRATSVWNTTPRWSGSSNPATSPA